MLAATLFAPLLVPYFYVLVMRISEKLVKKGRGEA